MHILLIHQAFAALDEPGGTRHHELARYMAQRGHRITVVASPVSYLTGVPGATKEQVAEPGVTILRARAYSAHHRSFVHRMLAFFSFMLSSFWVGARVKEVDLVWGTSPPIFQGVTAWGIARVKRVPLVFEVRDLWPAFAIQVGVLRQPVLISMSEWLERWLYRRADHLLVNSPGFLDHLYQRGAHQVELVPNGADPRMFDPGADGAVFRQAYGLKDKFVVLYAGAHGLSNDLGVVLEAAWRLQDRQEVVIVLVGDGKEKTALQEQAAQLRLPNVVFVPPVPKKEMPLALAAADACLAILKPIPLYNTVYPNKVFDYMAAGRAVLLLIDGVIRQVVEESRCGTFVPPGDPQALEEAIRQLADDPVEVRAMGQRGRSCVESRFDRARLAVQLSEWLERIVAKNVGK